MRIKKILTQSSFILILLGVPMLAFAIYNVIIGNQDKLGFYGPAEKDANGEIIYHTIPDFSFTNQLGKTVTEKDYQGKVYVANFFFAVCPGICPKMSSQLYRVQEAYKDDSRVRIISHSVDPVRDSVPVLAEYASQYRIDEDKWDLITGDKAEIYKIARNGYMIAALEGDGGPQEFIHSEKLVLIDTRGRIRGYYDGTEEKKVDQLIQDIKELLKSK